MATPSPYQRVGNASATPSDYDYSVGTLYLRFNGSNQWMRTNAIDFTGTDKVTVFAGARSFAEYGMIAEFSASSFISSNNGTFFLYDDRAKIHWRSRGTGMALASGDVIFPTTNVLSGIGDISGDRATLRINGVQVDQSTGDQGTGYYGNYSLYIGARAGTELFFNGRLYQLVVRGAQSTAQQIIDAEKYVANKTGLIL